MQYFTLIHDISHSIFSNLQRIMAAAEHLTVEIKKGTNKEENLLSITQSILDAVSHQINFLETIRFQTPSDFSPELTLSSISLLKDVIFPIAHLIKPAAQVSNINIELPSEDIQTAIVDRRAMQSALYNVVQNAIQYSQSPSTVSIILQKDSAFARIIVKNKGISIEPDEIEQIFKPGYRGRRAVKESAIGVGLGLHATKQIMTLHRGSVEIDSNPKGETTVSLNIPLNRARHEKNSPH
jgi:signal transduction histidine kinase